jgi:hypothetical protein
VVVLANQAIRAGDDIAARNYHAPLSQATVASAAVVVARFSTTCAIEATGERDSLVRLSCQLWPKSRSWWKFLHRVIKNEQPLG